MASIPLLLCRAAVVCALTWPALAQQQARIDQFSPQGTVKKVRQVHARFSEPMVPVGDPRSPDSPFLVQCDEKGSGRWVDGRNWVFDFERDLPAGARCEFSLRDGIRSLAGNSVGGPQRFVFSTGGPAILSSRPWEGSDNVDEEQVFLLELDSGAVDKSVLANASFTIEKVPDRVGIRIITGKERDAIVDAAYSDRPGRRPPHLLLIQAVRRFPAGARINLVWGRGITAPSGVATESDQVLPFVVRTPFTARFHCQRENPQAECVPVSEMRVYFSAPVLWSDVKGVFLKGPGRSWTPKVRSNPEEDEDARYVNELRFEPPFPEKSAFSIELPTGLKDDSGRLLSNSGSFPLTVRTDEFPPLAKFAADFGILESKGTPLLPVTLRNVEPTIAARSMKVTGGEGNVDPPDPNDAREPLGADVQGRVLRVPSDQANQMLHWISRVRRRTWEERGKSIFGQVTKDRAVAFRIPKPAGAKPFEVVGIPMKTPGFYVVEIESAILGSALLSPPKPMFVQTTVLVTNLAVHFKYGVESSLVWVTTLDRARPVAGATVEVIDCGGSRLWQGTTDRDGIARPAGILKPQGRQPECEGIGEAAGLTVTARLGPDMAFVHTTWNEGIESWRFQIPTEFDRRLTTAHTVFDRPLFRAGETVHMKHFLRRRSTVGFAPLRPEEMPSAAYVAHLGTNQRYPLMLKWDASGTAETTWTIPREAKLGEYQVVLGDDRTLPGRPYMPSTFFAGMFRVEEYRVPLMRAVIRPPTGPLVAPASVPLDLTVAYLAGGTAGNLPVKFRYEVHPGGVRSFEGYDGFLFSNGKAREGLQHGYSEPEEDARVELKSSSLTLDRTGSARTVISDLPRIEAPQEILAELEFRDPNGETQTAASRMMLLPASIHVGIKPDSWALNRNALKFQVAVLDLAGKPVANVPVQVDLLQRKTFSHRKRLVGGFYSYEHATETKRVQTQCQGVTNSRGMLLCENASPASGNLILQATAKDSSGREASGNYQVWVAGQDDWWFRAEDSDRIDVIPERPRYEPGDRARLQVRMPFRKATALISIEREGVAEAFVRELSGKEPVIEVPVRGEYAPNTYVSVLVVRGRVGDAKPTATVDLGRPAYKLGIAKFNVGWRAHELKVSVAADRPVYKVREKARVSIGVATADAKAPPPGAEVAVAAVDEGLLELMPNGSWQLLDAMMGTRGYGVQTSTAQMHVIGKRHFGLKALPQGGGGGAQPTRELFDTLLLWKARVPLDEKGAASVEIPLNDSITSFRVVAVASSGLDRFGTGSTTIRSTQDLMIFSGVAPVVREGDRFRSEFTVRNATERPLDVRVSARLIQQKDALAPETLSLAAGESKVIGWTVTAPMGVDSLRYEVEAAGPAGTGDRLAVIQKVVPAVPIRTYQATLAQLDAPLRFDVAKPADAVPGRGGVHVSLRPRLVDGLEGVTEYMRWYRYNCLEQSVSKAVALKEHEPWNRIMQRLPSYIDPDGLLKYFPGMSLGSEVLTAYVLAIANEAGWQIPADYQQRMTGGLRAFVEGKIMRASSLPTVDLAIRKLSAIEALSRIGKADPSLLSTIAIDPNLWPTSAVIDWANILKRVQVRNREERAREAQQILRSRLNLQGTTMGFSTERTDFLWWLMVSTDTNALRFILSQLDAPAWKEDMPRLVRGALGRQHRGHWDTTVANAWGVLAMQKFADAFERTPVTGTAMVALSGRKQTIDWAADPQGKTLPFPWPAAPSPLEVTGAGTGRPWVTVRSLAAIPMREPFSSGFKIRKTLTAVDRKTKGSWSKGDIVRVHLDLEAQSDMTWVVVDDPVPAGASVLGTGLGRDSALATRDEKTEGWVWPAFEERSFEAFRSYYQFVPKGTWTVEYTIRLNGEGTMNLPPTRVEALYSPEMFGEIPNPQFRVQ
jgi:alpha-2-macroglobulin